MTTSHDASRRRFLFGAAGATAFALTGGSLLAACGDDDDDPGSSESGGTTTTSAPEVADVTSMMPFAASLGYVLDLTAKSRGHFDDERLNVDIQFGRSAGQALQAVLSGQADIARAGVLEVVPAVLDQGATLTSIAMANQRLIYALLSGPDDPIRTIDEVEGKTVGLPSLGGNAETTLKLVLQEAGIDPASVTLVPAGFDAAAFGLIEEGRIDAMFTNTDIRATLEAQDVEIVQADLEDTNPLLGLVLTSTEEYRSANADVLARYLRALDAARAELQDEAALDEVIPALKQDWDIPALDDPELAKRIIGIQAELWFVDGDEDTFLRPVPERWEEGFAGFEEIGAVPEGTDPTRFYTAEYLDEALGR
jgi:ABC-type nitrate/sulfonate/bicarbonate transport system substrate-binding protein